LIGQRQLFRIIGKISFAQLLVNHWPLGETLFMKKQA